MAHFEVLDPDPDDPRLASVGPGPEAWADGSTLTIAARQGGRLTGTFSEELRPAGDEVWAVRFRVRGLERAVIEYGFTWPAGRTFRGPKAPPPAHEWAEMPERHVLASGEIPRRHPISLVAPAEPELVLLCADGAGAWHQVLEPEGVRAAVVGIESGGQPHLEGAEYEPRQDPRARAYLPTTDPPYFEAHMEYVVGTVLPWAEERLGRLPVVVFGVSNGAVWAASAAALHAERFRAALAFSLGVEPAWSVERGGPPHALVAGHLEPSFDKATTAYAWSLHARDVPVRLRRPVRGHDYGMWVDELVPALRWALAR